MESSDEETLSERSYVSERSERSLRSERSGGSLSPCPSGLQGPSGDTLPWNRPSRHERGERRKRKTHNSVLDPAERAVVRVADERDRVQKKTFMKWVNKHLIKVRKHITDLYEDLRDGHNLISLLEVLSGVTLPREKGRMRFHRLQNVQIALDFLKQRQVKLVNIRNDDITDGNPKLTLGLIWTIILHFQVCAALCLLVLCRGWPPCSRRCALMLEGGHGFPPLSPNPKRRLRFRRKRKGKKHQKGGSSVGSEVESIRISNIPEEEDEDEEDKGTVTEATTASFKTMSDVGAKIANLTVPQAQTQSRLPLPSALCADSTSDSMGGLGGSRVLELSPEPSPVWRRLSYPGAGSEEGGTSSTIEAPSSQGQPSEYPTPTPTPDNPDPSFPSQVHTTPGGGRVCKVREREQGVLERPCILRPKKEREREKEEKGVEDEGGGGVAGTLGVAFNTPPEKERKGVVHIREVGGLLCVVRTVYPSDFGCPVWTGDGNHDNEVEVRAEPPAASPVTGNILKVQLSEEDITRAKIDATCLNKTANRPGTRETTKVKEGTVTGNKVQLSEEDSRRAKMDAKTAFLMETQETTEVKELSLDKPAQVQEGLLIQNPFASGYASDLLLTSPETGGATQVGRVGLTQRRDNMDTSGPNMSTNLTGTQGTTEVEGPSVQDPLSSGYASDLPLTSPEAGGATQGDWESSREGLDSATDSPLSPPQVTTKQFPQNSMKFRPDLIDMEVVAQQSNLDNLEQAFEIAESLGVTRLLDAEDVDVPSPDEKSVITYVSSIYDAFPKIPEGGEGIAAHEVDQRWAEYRSRFSTLIQWSRQHKALMANKNFPLDPVELKELYNEYVHFKETEIPAKELEKSRVEHLYKLLEVWMEFGRIKLPLGLHPNDLEEEWGKLILEMLEREKALRPAVERLELLLQMANKIQNMALDCEEKLTLAKNTLQADMSLVESGEAVRCERELGLYLQDCEVLIRQLNLDLNILRDEKYYQVEQLAFRASCLHEELVSLRLQCSSVYRKGHFSPVTGGDRTAPRGSDSGLSLSTGAQTLLGAVGVVGAMGAVLLRRPMSRSQLVAMSSSEDEGSLRFIYELLGWVEETQDVLERAEWGADLPSVEQNLQDHQNIHTAVEELLHSLKEARNYETKVSPNFRSSYSDTLAKLEHLYCKLLELSSWRLRCLESLHAFVCRCTEELIWLNEREEEELAYDWSQNNTNVNAKRELYAEMRSELEEKQEVMHSLQETADRLCQENHPAKQTVEAYSAALQTQWQWVRQLCVCVEQHLKDNTTYFQFVSDARDCETYLRQLQDTIKRQYTCDKSSRLSKLEDLLQDSMEEKEQLIEYRSSVASLVGRAKTVVQLRPRSAESTLGSTTPIRAICDYRQIEITISRGEECVLADNSQRTKWKVISPSGNEAMVPSVCFTVPPPNLEAMDTASRMEQLYQNVMSLWHNLHVSMKSVVSWHYLQKDIRTVSSWSLDTVRSQTPVARDQALDHLEAHLADFLSDSKESALFTTTERRELERDAHTAQEHCQDLLVNMETVEKDESVSRSYLSELQNIKLRLEEAEQRLMRGIQTPPPSNRSGDSVDNTVQIAEQEKLQSDLEGLRTSLGEVSRRCVTFFEEKPTSSSVPVLRSELNLAVEKIDRLHNLSSVHLHKLKTVDVLMYSLQAAESQVKRYESRLSEEDIVPAGTNAIQALREQLGTWQSELEDQEGVFSSLQSAVQKAREAGTQLNRLHPDRSPELERYQERATQLTERWAGVKRQMDTRRGELEALGSVLQQYRDGHSALIHWIEETTERQENTQPGKTDSKVLSEQLAQQTALVADIEKNQTKLDECQTHSKQYCTSVKDYELQLMTFRAFVSRHRSRPKRRRMHSSSDAITQEKEVEEEAAEGSQVSELLAGSRASGRAGDPSASHPSQRRRPLSPEERVQVTSQLDELTATYSQLCDSSTAQLQQLVQQQAKEEQRKSQSAIGGVIDLGTMETVPVFQAAQSGLIDLDTCHVLLEAQLTMGGLFQLDSPVSLSLEEGLNCGMIDTHISQSLSELESALHLVDQTEQLEGQLLPVAAAMEAGLIKEEVGLRILELQINTGGLRELGEGRLTLNSAGEMGLLTPRVYTKLGSRVNRRELIDPNTADKLNLDELRQRCILSDDTGLYLLPVKQQPGGTVCLRSGRKVGIFRAVQEGLIDRQVTVRLLEAQLFAGGISDPRSGHLLTVNEAVRHNLMDQDLACAMLTRQLQSGGILDPVTGDRLGVEEAIQRDLLSPHLALLVLESLWAFIGMLWPESGELLPIAEALQQGVISGELAWNILRQRHAIGALYLPETPKVVSLNQAKEVLEPKVAEILKEIQIPDVLHNMNQSGSPKLNRLMWGSTGTSHPPSSSPASSPGLNCDPSFLEKMAPEEQAHHRLLFHLMTHSYVDAHSGQRLVLLEPELVELVKAAAGLINVDPIPGVVEEGLSLTTERQECIEVVPDVNLPDTLQTREIGKVQEKSAIFSLPEKYIYSRKMVEEADNQGWDGTPDTLQANQTGLKEMGQVDLDSTMRISEEVDGGVHGEVKGEKDEMVSFESAPPSGGLPEKQLITDSYEDGLVEMESEGARESGHRKAKEEDSLVEDVDSTLVEALEMYSTPVKPETLMPNQYFKEPDISPSETNEKEGVPVSVGVKYAMKDTQRVTEKTQPHVMRLEAAAVKSEEDVELERLASELQQGGLLTEGGQRLLPDEAVAQGVLTGHTAVKLMAKAGLFGGFLDVNVCESLSMEDVMQEGLLDEDLMWSVLKSEKTLAGVVDVEKGKICTLKDAARAGLIDSNTAARLLEAQVVSGGVVDLRRDKKVSVTLAANLGLIEEDQREKLFALEKSYRGKGSDPDASLTKATLQLQINGVVDPKTKSPVPLKQALERGLLGQEEVYQALSQQVAEGGIVHHNSGVRLSVTDALQRGLVDCAISPKLWELERACQGEVGLSSNPDAALLQASTGSILDPDLRCRLTLTEAVSDGLLNESIAKKAMVSPGVTEGVLDPQSAQIVPYSDLVKQGKIDIKSGKRFLEVKPFKGIQDKQTGEILNLAKAIVSQQVDPVPALRMLQSQADTGGIIDISNGARLPLPKASKKGLVGEHMARLIATNQVLKGGLLDPSTGQRVSSLKNAVKDGLISREMAAELQDNLGSMEVECDDEDSSTPVASSSSPAVTLSISSPDSQTKIIIESSEVISPTLHPEESEKRYNLLMIAEDIAKTLEAGTFTQSGTMQHHGSVYIEEEMEEEQVSIAGKTLEIESNQSINLLAQFTVNAEKRLQQALQEMETPQDVTVRTPEQDNKNASRSVGGSSSIMLQGQSAMGKEPRMDLTVAIGREGRDQEGSIDMSTLVQRDEGKTHVVEDSTERVAEQGKMEVERDTKIEARESDDLGHASPNSKEAEGKSKKKRKNKKKGKGKEVDTEQRPSEKSDIQKTENKDQNAHSEGKGHNCKDRGAESTRGYVTLQEKEESPVQDVQSALKGAKVQTVERFDDPKDIGKVREGSTVLPGAIEDALEVEREGTENKVFLVQRQVEKNKTPKISKASEKVEPVTEEIPSIHDQADSEVALTKAVLESLDKKSKIPIGAEKVEPATEERSSVHNRVSKDEQKWEVEQIVEKSDTDGVETVSQQTGQQEHKDRKEVEITLKTTRVANDKEALLLKAKESILRKVLGRGVSEKQAAEELVALRQVVGKKESLVTSEEDLKTVGSPEVSPEEREGKGIDKKEEGERENVVPDHSTIAAEEVTKALEVEKEKVLSEQSKREEKGEKVVLDQIEEGKKEETSLTDQLKETKSGKKNKKNKKSKMHKVAEKVEAATEEKPSIHNRADSTPADVDSSASGEEQNIEKQQDSQSYSDVTRVASGDEMNKMAAFTKSPSGVDTNQRRSTHTTAPYQVDVHLEEKTEEDISLGRETDPHGKEIEQFRIGTAEKDVHPDTHRVIDIVDASPEALVSMSGAHLVKASVAPATQPAKTTGKMKKKKKKQLQEQKPDSPTETESKEEKYLESTESGQFWSDENPQADEIVESDKTEVPDSDTTDSWKEDGEIQELEITKEKSPAKKGKSSLLRQECLERDQQIVALLSMVRHIEVRVKQQQQQSIGRSLIALDDIIKQTDTLDLELRDLEPQVNKAVDAAWQLLEPRPPEVPPQLLLALEKDGRSLARGYEAARGFSENILQGLRAHRDAYTEALTGEQKSLGGRVEDLLSWLKETEAHITGMDGQTQGETPAQLTQQLQLCKELQSSLSARSNDVNTVAFDIQVFISERAQDLAPEQSRHLLGQLQQLQRGFHRAAGQAHAKTDALAAQREREEERQRRREEKEEEEKERERERESAREREVVQQQKAECSQKLEGLTMWLAGAASMLANQRAGAESGDVNVLQQKQRELKEVQKDLLTRGEGVAETIRSVEEFLAENGDSLSPEERANLQGALSRMKEQYSALTDTAQSSLVQLDTAISTTVQQNTQRAKAVEELQETRGQIDSLLEELSSLDQPGVTVTDHLSSSSSTSPEGGLQSHSDMLQAELQQLQAQQAQLMQVSQNVRSLLDQPDSAVSAEEKRRLRDQLDQLQTQHQEKLRACQERLRRSEALKDDLAKFLQEHGGLGTWLEQSEGELCSLGEGETDAQGLKGRLEEHKKLAEDVICHKADLRFVSISGQKVLDSVQGALEKVGGSDPALEETKQLVTGKLQDANHRYTALHTKSSDLGGRLSGLLERYQQYQDEAVSLHTWLSAQEQNQSIAGPSGETDTQTLQNTLRAVQLLQDELAERSVQLEKVRRSGRELANTRESPTLRAAEITSTADGLEKRFSSLSESVSERAKSVSQTIEEVRAEQEQEAGQLKSFCQLGTDLSQAKALTSTQTLLDNVREVSDEFARLETNINERYNAIQSCEQQLGQFRSLSGSLLRWLQTTQEQLPLKEPNVNTEALQRRVQQLKDLLSDWKAQGVRVLELNKTGSELETLIINITAPQTKTGVPQVNGAGSPSSVNGIHTCKDLTELQVAVAEVNGRYEELGEELKDRQWRQETSLELRQKARQSTEELSRWLGDRENSLHLGQTAASPSKPEVVRAQAQENKALLSELAEHSGKVKELKSTLEKLIADNPDSPEADTWRQQMKEIDSRWAKANEAAVQRQVELETCADRLGSFATAASQLGPWLKEKELMMSVLGPLSIDPNMLNTQNQQVQFMLREFETRRPQFDQLTQAAEGILSPSGGDASPQDAKDLAEVRSELGSISQQWDDLTQRLSRRSEHIDQAQGTSERYQALLKNLSVNVGALGERLDGQASLSAQPEALKRRLQETGEIRSELEQRREELGEAEKLCGELSAIVVEPYLRDELKKRLESVSGPLRSLEERAADGLSQLQAALSSTQQFQQMFKELRSWLDNQSGQRDSTADSLPCQPEAIRTLLAQQEELHRGVASQRGPYELIQAEGASLLASLPAGGEERSALLSRLTALRQDWDELNQCITERQNRMKSALTKAESYQQHRAELTPWVAECEEREADIQLSLDPAALEEALQKSRQLCLDVDRRRPLLEALNIAADQLLEHCRVGEEDVRDEKAQLNRRVDRLAENLQNRVSQLEELAGRLKEFEDGRQAVERRLEAARHQIEVQEALGPQACSNKSLERLRSQQETLHSLQPQVAYLRDLAQGLVQDAPHTAGGGGEGGQRLEQQARDTDREFGDVSEKIEKCCSTLESRLQGVGEVQSSVRDLFSHLADLDDELDSLSPVGRDADSLASQADAVQAFLARLATLRSELEGHGGDCTAMLRREGSSPDLLALRRETEALSRQAGKLSERGQARMGQIEVAAEKVGEFYAKVAELQGLLGRAEEGLNAQGVVGTEVENIKQQLHEFKAVEREQVDSIQPKLQRVNAVGQGLIQSAAKHTDTQALEHDLETTNLRWNSLNKRVAERIAQLQEALLHCGKFQDALEPLLSWLSDTEELVANQKPPSAEYRVVKAQIQEQKLLQRLLDDRRATFQMIQGEGERIAATAETQDRDKIQKQLESLGERWGELLEKARARQCQLEELQTLALQFHEAVEPLGEWLSATERRLSTAEPMGTQTSKITQQITKHKVTWMTATWMMALQGNVALAIHGLCLSPWNETGERRGWASKSRSPLEESEVDRLQALGQSWRPQLRGRTRDWWGARGGGPFMLEQRPGQCPAVWGGCRWEVLNWLAEVGQRLGQVSVQSYQPGSSPSRHKHTRPDVTVSPATGPEAFSIIDIIRHKDTVEPDYSTDQGRHSWRTCSDQQRDALVEKTDSLSARYEAVSQQHQERFSALEQAQVLVARFWETQEDLEPWLGETETLIAQLPPPAIDTEALRLQQEQMRLLRESIAEHKPHIDKLLKIGPQLAALSHQEGATVRQRYSDAEKRYVAIKEVVKGRATTLDEAVSQSAQFHDKMDPLLETLEGAVQRLRSPPPVAAEADKIREQLADHKATGLELDKLLPSFSALCARGEELISRAAHDDPAAQAVRSRLLRLRSLWDEIRQRAEEREGKLTDVLDLAGKFWADMAALLSTLRDSQDIVKELEDPGVDPSLIKQQIEAAEAIKAETDGLREELEFVRTLGADLIFACGETEKPEVKKTIDEMNVAWEGLNRTWRERMERLEEAMTASVQYQDALQSMFDYLDNAVIKLCDMSTVGTDLGTVKQQIEELKQYKVEVYQQQIDMEKLCHQGELLLKKVSDQTDRDMIQEPLTELRHLWDNLGDKITHRQHKLEGALLALGQFQHALSELQSWLSHTHATLDTQRPINSDPKAIEIELAKHHVLRNDVLSHRSTVETVNAAGAELLESSPGDEANHLRGQLDHLNRGWENLLLKTQDRQKLLEAALHQAEGFHGELEEFLQWLRRTESQLSAAKPTGGLPETAREQLQQHLELQTQLAQRAEQYNRLLDAGESMLLSRGGEEGGPGAGTTQTQQNLALLQNKWASLNTKMDDRRAKLDEAVSLATGFQSSLQDTINWLTQAEQTLNMAQPPSLILDTVLFQIDEHKVFVNEVNTHREQVLALEKAGSQLRFASVKQDVVLIKNLLLSVQARWDKLVQRSLDRGRHLDEARKRAKQFHEAWRKLSDWLEEAESRLDSELEISNEPDKIKIHLTKHKEFQKALGSKQPVYDTTVRSGKAMRDKAMLPEDTQKLDHLLGEVRDKWDTVCGKSVERQHKLEEALLFSGQFAEALQALVDWLYRVEPQLAEDLPVHGDLDLVSNLMDSHKAFQKELGKRTTSVHALKRSARELMETGRDDTAWVKVQLQELSNRWDTVCALSVTKQTRLQQALKQAEEFRTAVQLLLEWLSEAEQTLRFRGVLPEEAETLQTLLHTHRNFMATVEEKRTDVNRAAGQGEAILTACQADCITTIKHWITIIRARFEEVLTWAKQHEQRLETALTELLNNATLLEELLSWLQWAETTLVQRDRETLPQDIPQIKTLITEHQVFMEEMTRKQPDVDKVTKTYKRKPAEPPSSLAERRGARKNQQQQQHQQAAMQVAGGNTRLTQLCSRWQQVWLLALDRQRKLNDALDRLEELKEFASFDFDVWRKKYMRWMNHKKSRVMDFFRRIDKDQDGKITRQEFIDGILASKFPTSRLEMTAVADIFDQDGDGYIDYYEFVAALHPNKDAYRPTTDADKIEDEVTRQVAQCKCAKRFQVEQIGENKYRFFLGNQFGDSQQLRLVRILRSTVMVRVGGGWMALDEFLVKNDPCRARGRTNLELREKFILPEGASQGLAAFRSRGRRSKPGSRTASPTRSSSSASHSAHSCASLPSTPATPTASSRSSNSRGYAKPWLAHSKTPTPTKCQSCPDHDHTTPGHEGAVSGSKLKRPTFHSSRGSLTGENGGATPTSTKPGRTDPRRTPSGASGAASRAGSRAGSRASSRRGSDASDASELLETRSACSDTSDTPRRPGAAKPSKIPTISKKTPSPKTPASGKK
nr:LOW QUALITY PROTEIN: microtubule-actin cross-linking factor 1-like [Salvelinus alpinus]